MRPIRWIPASLFLLAACAGAAPAIQTPQAVSASATAGVDRAAALITADAVRERVEFLASDALRGRDTPSPGLEEAARYAADQFRSFGLEPAGDDGTFIQRWPLTAVSLDMETLRVEARTDGDAARFRYGADYFLLPARTDSVVGEPVFVGRVRPGMTLSPDVRGRIVFAFVPDTAMAAWSQAAGGVLQAALPAGATAVVLVLDPDFTRDAVGNVAHQVASQVLPFPVVGLRYDAARRIFDGSGIDLDADRDRIDGAARPLAGRSLLIRGGITTQAAQVPNVVAVLPGSDPALRDQYVVFSAHFDHVGVGMPDAAGDSIYNGADDNASGTTAVLMIARAFGALEQRPARSVMFVLVSGEEKGLLGSQYFVEHPPVPISQMVANINMDMVGRNAPDTVVAIGQDYSSLGPLVHRVAARHPDLGLTIAPDLWPEEQLFFRSDHFSFAAKEIPAIFFTTGLHEQYHRPGDEAHLIDNDKIARLSRLLFRYAHEIADTPEPPRWTAEGLEQVRRQTRGR